MADPHIVQAKVIDHAFDSRNAIQYFPGDIVSLDLTNPAQRKLVWLKTLGGKRWVFEFDRANASSPYARIFFCKECGQPFDKATELGNHSNATGHNETKKIIAKAQQDEVDEAEEALLAKMREAAERGDNPVEIAAIKEPEPTSKKKLTYTCKTCGEVQPNPYAMRMHYKTHAPQTVEA